MLPAADPIRTFEHSHETLTQLALEVRRLVADDSGEQRAARKRLLARIEVLREELLEHFAKEEEGLFPFVRHHLPLTARAVDRLEASHDAICGSLVRLAHLVASDRKVPAANHSTLIALYERFEKAYGEHSRDEALLLQELGRALDERQRRQLAELLRGL